jgi:uncharacterized protein
MAIKVNLRHLEEKELRIAGQLTVGELDVDTRDEVVQVTHPLEYELEVQRLESGLLVQGRLALPLDCECVRCLKPFRYDLEIKNYSTLLVLEGEEAVPVVNDCVDLTAQVREDILLEFPQHPLCDQECRGLQKAAMRTTEDKSSGEEKPAPSAWAELNKLKVLV